MRSLPESVHRVEIRERPRVAINVVPAVGRETDGSDRLESRRIARAELPKEVLPAGGEIDPVEADGDLAGVAKEDEASVPADTDGLETGDVDPGGLARV